HRGRGAGVPKSGWPDDRRGLDDHGWRKLLFPLTMKARHSKTSGARTAAVQPPRSLMVSVRCARPVSRRRNFLALALLSLLPCGAFLCAAQTATEHEYALKAGVLYHIPEYVDWPAGSLSNKAPAIQIGLLGEIPFASAL